MSTEVVVVTDGSPEATALTRWLSAWLPSVHTIDALDAADARRVVESGLPEGRARVAVLTQPAVSEVDEEGVAAMGVAVRWLGDLSPFDKRVRGRHEIERRIAEEAEGADVLLRLLRRLTPGRPKGTRRRAKRGRPKGSDPFRGVGFDVCVRLLLDPELGWSERALAESIGHSAYGVHRVLVELDERGFLERERGSTKPSDAILLRDALAAAWKERMASSRVARGYLLPPGRRDIGALFERAEQRGLKVLLAGASATSGPERLVGGPATAYLAGSEDELLAAGFEATHTVGAAELIVWEPAEDAVMRVPRRVDGHPATNHVVTFLDLATVDSERYQAAARSLWEAA